MAFFFPLTTQCSHAYTLQSNGDILTRLPSFHSIYARFPTPKLTITLNKILFQSVLASCTTYEEETFYILDNPFKTLGPGCSKIG